MQRLRAVVRTCDVIKAGKGNLKLAPSSAAVTRGLHHRSSLTQYEPTVTFQGHSNQQRFFQTGKPLKDILRSRYPDELIPDISLHEFLFKDIEQKFDGKPMLINGLTGESFTCPEFVDLTYRVASGLTKHGVKKGKTVMIISRNDPEYFIIFHAVLYLGATVTMVNPDFTKDGLVAKAELSRPSYIYTDSESLETAQYIREKTNNIHGIFVNGESAIHTTLQEMMSDDGDARPKHVGIDPDKDVAFIPYSSGTTGLPKAVMLGNKRTIANVLIAGGDDFGLDNKNFIQLALLPLFHAFGFYLNMSAALHWGQTVVTLPGFEPQTFLDTMLKYKVSLLAVPPPLMLFLCKHPLVDKLHINHLKRLVCAAAPLPADIAAEFQEKFPNVNLTQAWGMTELGPLATVGHVKENKGKPDSSGIVLPNTQLKFVNVKTGEEVKAGENGEIWVKSPSEMLGYLGNQQATDETIDKDGWLHTGDIGYHDEEGHVFIIDRLKDLIKVKGLQVAPAELEAVIVTHPEVLEAAVIPVADERAGELPKAYVSRKPGASVTEEDITQFVAERVAPHMQLKGGVIFIDVIPKTASGKLLRRELKERNE